ncbi:ankyrin repeat domain protein [Nitzschia inconspicua]|uniref:Ankyrin repeat domain protein n=1 Tax=Nitzschia inconspicua TaxID=303405 RepID=A0A9K3PHY1_9STRA|nr:ankyrin repeat domain protein [Nitzschia inconspicua]
MNITSPGGSSARSLEVSEDGKVVTNQSMSTVPLSHTHPERMSPAKRNTVGRSRSADDDLPSSRKQSLIEPVAVSTVWHDEKRAIPSPCKSKPLKIENSKRDDSMDYGSHSKTKKSPCSKSSTATPRTRNNHRLGKDFSPESSPFLPVSVPNSPATPQKTYTGHSKKSSPSSSKGSPDSARNVRRDAHQSPRSHGGKHLPLSSTPDTRTAIAPREISRSPSTLKRIKEGSMRHLINSSSSDGEMNSSASSLRASSHHSSSSNNAIPNLYRFARKGKWDEFSELLQNSSREDFAYVYKKDGTTALHLAVMSRTGYIDSFTRNSSSSSHGRRGDADPNAPNKKKGVASLEVVEEILKRAPFQCKLRCTLNGYTPLTYACLVCNNEFSTEGAAAMVRLIIQYCPESVNIFTDDGLSPVDIHVVSYSHHHKEKEEESGLGNTSTAVLRTLLNHAPELANLRLKRDADGTETVDGPLELLYKCNAQAFSKATLDEVYNSDDEGTIQSDYTLPEKRQQVMDTVKTWWIWTWVVLLLKYGSKANNKKRGARFAAVHTASNQVGLPTPLLSICLYAFPRQIKKPIEDTTELGNLPLHAVCSWPCHHDNQTGVVGDAFVTSRKVMAINRILEEYSLALKVTNARGDTALGLALRSGTTWDGGVRRMVKAYPKSLRIQSESSGLYPFMTAAAAAAAPSECNFDNMSPSSSERRRELRHVRTIYGLLRSNPKALALACQHSI